MERAGGRILAGKTGGEHARDVRTLAAAFKEASGAQDAVGGIYMCVDYTDTIFTCMMDLGVMDDVQRKQNLVPIFAAYYDGCTRE